MKGNYKGAVAKPSKGAEHTPRKTTPGSPQTGASAPVRQGNGPRTP